MSAALLLPEIIDPAAAQDKCAWCKAPNDIGTTFDRIVVSRGRSTYTRAPTTQHTSLKFCNKGCYVKYQADCDSDRDRRR